MTRLSLPSCEGSGLKYAHLPKANYGDSLPSCEGSGLKYFLRYKQGRRRPSPLV